MNTKPLLLGVAALGLGTCAWFLLRNGDEAPIVRPPVAGAEAGNSAAAGSPGGTAQGVVADDAGGAAHAPAADIERVAAAVAPGEPVPARPARITGRLVDAADAPLARTKLAYATFRNPDGLDFPAPRGDDDPRHELETDADGAFAFELARDRSAQLELPGADLVFAERAPFVRGGKGDRDLGALVVLESARIRGTVVDQRGQPVADVRVAATEGRIGLGTTNSAVTAADGTFSVGKLRPGVWTLRTASAQFLPAERELRVERATQIDDVVLTVAPGRAIAGQVVDDLGRPVAAFKVGAKRAEARGGVDIERFSADEATETDANGMFTLSGLEGETATVRAFGPGHSSTFAAGVRVGTGDLLLKVDRLAVVEGVLQAPDGTPLEGSRVRAVPAGDDGLGGQGIEAVFVDGGASTRTGADGTFRIEDVRPGLVTIVAEGKTHRPARRAGVQVRPAQTVSGVQLVADRGATARLTVVDEGGQPVAKAKVRVERPRADGHGGMQVRGRRVEDDGEGVRMFGMDDALGTAETDAAGVAVISGLPDEMVVFEASHPDYADAVPKTYPLLPNGTVDATLTLRTPGFADVRVTQVGGGAVPEAELRVRALGAAEGFTKNGRTDAEGKVLIGPLPAGAYVAELVRDVQGTSVGGAHFVVAGDEGSAIGGSAQRFTITAGETTVVEVLRPVLARVHGVVSGPDGPAAECTVQIAKDADSAPMPGMGGGRTVTTAADGTFAIDDVEAGRYVLTYGRTEQLVKAELPLTVPPDVPELRQDLVLRVGKIRVQAWDSAANAPIAGAEVEVKKPRPAEAGGERRERRMVMISISTSGDEGADSTMMTFGAQRAKTGADGWAEIDDVPVGDWDLRVTHDRFTPGEKRGVGVHELQTSDAGRVEMGPAGRIRGKVLAADGGAVPMALVFQRPVGGEEGQPTPAMGGAFTLDALAAGRYVLRAQELAIGNGGPGAFGPEVEVEVAAGETATAELRLPAR